MRDGSNKSARNAIFIDSAMGRALATNNVAESNLIERRG